MEDVNYITQNTPAPYITRESLFISDNTTYDLKLQHNINSMFSGVKLSASSYEFDGKTQTITLVFKREF